MSTREQERSSRVPGKRCPTNPGHPHGLIGRHTCSLSRHQADGNHRTGITGTRSTAQPLMRLSIIAHRTLATP
jgi:hypothetical protein